MEISSNLGLRALVVDDEENISYLISAALRNNGFDVQVVANGKDGIARARTFNPQVVILDVMLPDMSGTDVVKTMREQGVTSPVIFLSARSSTEDRVRGLTAGGDDYMVKPFSLEELIARINAQIRRTGISTKSSNIEIQDLLMDLDAYRVWRSGEEVVLTSTEFVLLRYLMQNVGKVCTRSQILDHVWNYDFGGDGAIIETYISHLRKKIDRGNVKLIHTVRGIGYCLRPSK